MTKSLEVGAFEEAIAILQNPPGLDPHVGSNPLCDLYRARAIEHLCQRMRATLQDGPVLDSEGAVRSVLKSTAQELRVASHALEAAARSLKGAGVPSMANATHQASKRARAAAEGLVPD